MEREFKNFSIRYKLTLLILCSSALGLVLACVALVGYERRSFRESTLDEISALADTQGANAAASMLFNDQKTGADMLHALSTEHHIHDVREPSAALHVLVAEDNAVNQRLITRLLEKRGHEVKVAGNGREAVDALNQSAFDLVLMDVQMPEMDGLAATATIRERELVSGWHQPIIALTAHAMKGDQERCLAAGMDGYLTKPIRPQELDAILDKYSPRKTKARHLLPAVEATPSV